MISVIVPCFNEEENIRTYNERLFPIINSVSELIGESFEYVFVLISIPYVVHMGQV